MKFYQLTEEVENPRPDRRKKYDWRSARSVPAGGLYVQRPTPEGKVLAPVEEPACTVSTKHPTVLAMAPSLEPHPDPTLGEMLRASMLDPGRILRSLVKEGDIDLDVVEARIDALLEKDAS